MTFRSRRRRNLILLAVSVLVAIFLSRQEVFRAAIFSLGNFGYLGAFLAGVMFASFFTVSFSAVILSTLAQELPVVLIAPIAGVGAVLGDILVLRFIKDELINDLEPIYQGLGGSHLTKLLHTKYFSWTLPVIGALIMASPLPDEIGITLLSMAKLPKIKFILLSYILNTIGILTIISLSLAI